MSPLNSLWFKWKSLKLPWRKTYLMGSDLAGNTFWEFKDSLNAGRFRRIVKFSPKTHYADVKISPQWHQWLRYVRPEPPSLDEQRNDLLRQERTKHLAKLADERWASKPSFLDKPQAQQPGPATQSPNAVHKPPQPDVVGTGSTVESSPVGASKAPKKKDNPWAKANATGPSEKWQPESWSPDAAKR